MSVRPLLALAQKSICFTLLYILKWLRSQASETCLLSLKVRACNVHVLAPDSAEGNQYPSMLLQGTASYTSGLLISCMIYAGYMVDSSAQILISLSEHPKHAKIVLSSLPPAYSFLTSDLKENFLGKRFQCSASCSASKHQKNAYLAHEH